MVPFTWIIATTGLGGIGAAFILLFISPLPALVGAIAALAVGRVSIALLGIAASMLLLLIGNAGKNLSAVVLPAIVLSAVPVFVAMFMAQYDRDKLRRANAAAATAQGKAPEKPSPE